MSLDDLVVLIILFLMALTSTLAVISGLYIEIKVRPAAEKVGLNDYLRILFSRDRQVAFVPVLSDIVVAYSLLRIFFPELNLWVPPPGLFAALIGLSMIVMRRGVIRDALQFRKDRRSGRSNLTSIQDTEQRTA